MKNCAHQYFTLRRHWCCHTSQQDLSAALWEGVWFPHTSLLTQGSLTVTYARGDRSVRGKICVSAHISSVLLPWNLITSEAVRNPWPWCYDTSKTCRDKLPVFYVLHIQKNTFKLMFSQFNIQAWTTDHLWRHTIDFYIFLRHWSTALTLDASTTVFNNHHLTVRSALVPHCCYTCQALHSCVAHNAISSDHNNSRFITQNSKSFSHWNLISVKHRNIFLFWVVSYQFFCMKWCLLLTSEARWLLELTLAPWVGWKLLRQTTFQCFKLF